MSKINYDERDIVGNNLHLRVGGNIINDIFVENENMESTIKFENVPMDFILPRAVNDFIQSDIDSLAESIKITNNRLINPITIAPLEFLDDENELIKEYKNKGIDISNKKYYIVAGERRYRAIEKLRNETIKKMSSSGMIKDNPFDTITANILTKEEMKNEAAFYEDSNLRARQLTPLECMKHVQHLMKKTDTKEEKDIALKEIQNDKDYISKYGKPKRFNQALYYQYYLKTKLGFDSWTDSTIRVYVSLLNQATNKLIQEIFMGNIPVRDSLEIYQYAEKTQNKLIDIYKEDKKKYQEEIAKLSQPKTTKTDEYKELIKTIKTLNKTLISRRKDIEKNKRKFNDETKIQIEIISNKIEELSMELLKIK